MPPLTVAERDSLNNVDRGRNLVTRRAAEARRIERDRDHARERQKAVEVAQSMILQPDPHHTNFYWLIVLCMAATYILDAVLFAPALEDLVSETMAASPFWLNFARFSIPAVIVMMESTIGAARDRARDHVYGLFSSRVLALTLLGLAMALVMPGMIACTQIAAYLAKTDPGRWELYMMIAKLTALTALSLSVHMFLVLSGREGSEARAYVMGRIQHWHWGQERRQFDHRYIRALQVTDDAFARYETVRNDHNTHFPQLHREQGPFDPDTIGLLNRGRSPQQGQQTSDAPTPAATPTPDGAAPFSTPPAPEPGLHSNESEATPF